MRNKKHSVININDLIPGCKNFYWYEFLYLKGIDAFVVPPDEVKEEIILTAQVMQEIRDILGRPISLSSGYRPKPYNIHIKGALKSQHIIGKAADFKVFNMNCDRVRELLVPYLNKLKIRMERKPGSSWVHIDRKLVSRNRYFKP